MAEPLPPAPGNPAYRRQPEPFAMKFLVVVAVGLAIAALLRRRMSSR